MDKSKIKQVMSKTVKTLKNAYWIFKLLSFAYKMITGEVLIDFIMHLF